MDMMLVIVYISNRCTLVAYVVGTHWNCIEANPMCTYNICSFSK